MHSILRHAAATPDHLQLLQQLAKKGGHHGRYLINLVTPGSLPHIAVVLLDGASKQDELMSYVHALELERLCHMAFDRTGPKWKDGAHRQRRVVALLEAAAEGVQHAWGSFTELQQDADTAEEKGPENRKRKGGATNMRWDFHNVLVHAGSWRVRLVE